VRTTDPGELLAEDDIVVDARVHGGTWTPLSDPDMSQTLTERSLAKGDRVRVDLRVAFVPGSTNRSEIKELPLRFVVQLTQSGAGPHDGQDGPGLLPDTGSTVEPVLLYLAAALLGGGLLILIVRRRKEEPDD